MSTGGSVATLPPHILEGESVTDKRKPPPSLLESPGDADRTPSLASKLLERSGGQV